jgi:8-oxo-dGTP pyrophosphatase MutT (NUDIX family)
MDMTIFQQKDILPSFVVNKLASIQIDYKEKYRQIKDSSKTAAPQLAAGVVLLLHYKKLANGKSEYVFQLIKRSEKVSQAGDISCPGGMLHPATDKIISNLLTTGLLPSLHRQIAKATINKDRNTISLIRLFLINALREAWEEIGLNPFRVLFLGALPCYSLTLVARTIFPLVCVTPEPFEFRLSAEVEKILEVPVSTFFDGSNYALLEIETPFRNSTPLPHIQFPCLLLRDNQGGKEILWGATYNIIINFLRIISGNSLPVPSSPVTIKKVLSKTYISRNSQ